MKAPVENRVAELRKARGVAASDLARRVGVSRQTIYAIEAGTYVPNTEVALRLARELEVPVDELFSLARPAEASSHSVRAEVLTAAPAGEGQAVRVCRVASRWVSVPVIASPYYIPEADGIIQQERRGETRVEFSGFDKDAAHKRLVIAGCDPATGLLARMVERVSGVEVVSAAASSRLALRWLKEEKIHVAGSHLEDAKTGQFNLPFLRKEFAGEDLCIVTFARWEEGLVVPGGNPKQIRKVEDLARKDVRFINREPGSGSRALLDRLLAENGIESRRVHGYDRVGFGHLAAAYAVLSREADVCLATRSAAKAFALPFVPLHTERYDLIMRRRTADLPAMKALLDVLQRAALRRKVEMLAGYDTSEMGSVVEQ
jgi:molybdopterin molybdotransferase/putative molybdopterin biosynthesis protein